MNDTPAFPPMHDPNTHEFGMTLRDYFAAKAMSDMDWRIKPYDNLQSNADDCYAIANAMMKAREA